MSDETKPNITPTLNGPYLVKNLEHLANQRGPIEAKPTVALCRCGGSANKPFCDGTHRTNGFSSAKLRDPDVSLRLGTYHLKEVVDRFDGSLELALAAYNAGAKRADEWITWGNFEEPAEFVETIPFTETRGYVQSVLRNRDMYRRLYGPRGGANATLAGQD